MKRIHHQFRLVWKYKGEARPRTLVADRTATVLSMLYRIGTEQPHLGVNGTQLKRAWAWVARRLHVGFEAVKPIPVSEVLTTLRNTYPQLEYIRVEMRQVGAWTQMLDPLNELRTPAFDRRAKLRQALFDEVAAMTPEQLDAWRWVPADDYQTTRRIER